VRIRTITLTGSFGNIDHHIPLFQREPTRIIHGPSLSAIQGTGRISVYIDRLEGSR